MNLTRFLQDPPPDFVFEIARDSIAMARTAAGAVPLVEELAPSVLSPSPLRDNVIEPDALAHAVNTLVATLGPSKKRRATLILPDHSARVSVLDFDHFPDRPEEQLPLLQFRLKKSLPYDIDSAVIRYFVQPPTTTGKHDVVTVATPLEVIARYEAPFRAAHVHTGVVTISHLALLDLVPATGVIVIAKLSGGVLTVMAVDHGLLRLVRSLELTEITLDEIAADLYPTFAYSEDSFGARPDNLLLVGFGDLAEPGARRFEDELAAKVHRMSLRHPGLAGYLRSRNVQGVAA